MKMNESTARAQLNDVSFLCEQYNLGSMHIVKDLGGTYNLNLLVQTENDQYVLRLYRSWVTLAHLSQLQHVKYLLACAGFPVPVPLSSISGETILHYHNYLLELEPFIAHDGEADTWKRNITAFSLLGKLHTFLKIEERNIYLTAPVLSNYGNPEMLLAWIRQAVEESTDSSRHTQQAFSLYTEAIQMIITLQEQWSKTKDYLPKQLIHGDYGGGNLLFLNELPVAILDFDFMAIRERVFELAYSLYWWIRKQGTIADESSWYRVRELITSYNQANLTPLSTQEIQALPLEIARVPLYWIAETHLFSDPISEAIKHTEKMLDAHWILEHASQLTDLFL